MQKIKSVIWTYFVDPRKVKKFYPNNEILNLCSAFTDFSLGYFIAYIFPFGSIIMCYTRTKKITKNTPKFFDDSPQICEYKVYPQFLFENLFYIDKIFNIFRYYSTLVFSIHFTLASWISMVVIHFTTSSVLFRQNILALITNFNGLVAVFVLCYKSVSKLSTFSSDKQSREKIDPRP